jgi:hypothetical protein
MFATKFIVSTAIASLLASATAFAVEMDFVTDRALCSLDPFDRLELGMTMQSDHVFTIEYGCFYEPLDPID